MPNSGTVNNSSSSPANENNNTLTTEDKLAKQNVKYDMSTGKVYEELGGSSGNNPAAVVTGASAPPGGTTNCNNASRTRSTLDYTPYGSSQQSYHSAAAASSYPYGNYMSSFSSPYATSPGSYPYDRYIVLLVLTQGAHCLRSEKKFHFDFDFFHFYLIKSVIWQPPAMHPGDWPE